MSTAKGASPESGIATSFRRARQSATALDRFPGDIPEELPAAYAIQDRAIADWPDRIAGWKVGMITGENAVRFGSTRLAGPIFSDTVMAAPAAGQVADFEVIEGGFAAVEAELVFVLSSDAPADKTRWTMEEAAGMVAGVRAGIEIAGSPLSTINDLGPPVIISDFGNNTGLILGPELPDWRRLIDSDQPLRTWIEGRLVGEGAPMNLNGGALESLRFLLENSARRGLPLKKGYLVSSGAVTGVHDIAIGESAEIEFTPELRIACRACKAK